MVQLLKIFFYRYNNQKIGMHMLIEMDRRKGGRMTRIFYQLYKFIYKLSRDHIGAYAAQAAYYIMLSCIPFLMLLLSLIKYTPVTKADLMQYMVDFLPTSVNPLVTTIVEELYTKSVTLISVTAIMAAWSAARGILAITAGFNSVYDVSETRNYFVLRLRSALYTILLLVLVVFSLIVLVFGQSLHSLCREKAPFLAEITQYIVSIRFILFICIQTALFLFLFRFIPNRKSSLLWQLPGALFTSIGWNIFSYAFSFYLERFSNMTYMYGSLTTLIIIMLWLYFCMYIMLIGAGVNAFIEQTPSLHRWMAFADRKNKK